MIRHAVACNTGFVSYLDPGSCRYLIISLSCQVAFAILRIPQKVRIYTCKSKQASVTSPYSHMYRESQNPATKARQRVN